jgi:predicted transcriptional regulator
MKISFTDREADVMHVLWEQGPSVLSDVQSQLSDRLVYTTVLTVLRTLEAKGFVTHQEQGRRYRYFAKGAATGGPEECTESFAGKVFKDSSELLFAHLVSDRTLSPEQIRRMRKFLAGGSKKG